MRKINFAILVGAFGLFGWLASGQAAAQFNPLEQACTPTTDPATGAPQSRVDESGVCTEAESQGTANPITGDGGILEKIARILILLIGIGSVIMLIYGGYMFVTAGGAVPGQRSGDSPNKAAKAKSTILYAIVGLLVAALSWTLITFVIDRLLE